MFSKTIVSFNNLLILSIISNFLSTKHIFDPYYERSSGQLTFYNLKRHSNHLAFELRHRRRQHLLLQLPKCFNPDNKPLRSRPRLTCPMEPSRRSASPTITANTSSSSSTRRTSPSSVPPRSSLSGNFIVSLLESLFLLFSKIHRNFKLNNYVHVVWGPPDIKALTGC